MILSHPPFRWAPVFAVALFLGLATGCSTGSGKGETFGQSTRQTFQAQVIRPNAPADPTPSEEMPGYVAGQIYNNRYVDRLGGTTGVQ